MSQIREAEAHVYQSTNELLNGFFRISFEHMTDEQLIKHEFVFIDTIKVKFNDPEFDLAEIRSVSEKLKREMAIKHYQEQIIAIQNGQEVPLS